MIIAATLIYGIGSVFIKMISPGNLYPLSSLHTNCSPGGFLLMAAGLLMGGSVPLITWKGIALFLYLISISAAAFSIWNTLIKYNPIAKIAIFGSSIPAFRRHFIPRSSFGEEYFDLAKPGGSDRGQQRNISGQLEDGSDEGDIIS